MSSPTRSRSIRAAIVGCAAAAVAFWLLAAAQSHALTVTSSVAGGVLTASSDADDPIAVTCDGGGGLKVNGADPGTGAFPCADLQGVVINGGPGGNDIDLSGLTSPAALPQGVNVNGGDGNDTIIGTPLADTLNGQGGDDDIVGFRGDDIVTGGDGDDLMIWDNGDGSDRNDGEAGTDVSVVNGAPAGDDFRVRPGDGDRVFFERVNLGTFSVDIGTTEGLQLNGLGGDDVMDGSTPGLADRIVTEMNGGDGNDTLTGTDGADFIAGDAGNDRLTGFRGDDAVVGGDGDDSMIWNNGDNTDTNDGENGNDISIVNGAPGGDDFRVRPADGGRVLFQRVNLVPFDVSIGTTERLQLNGLDGDDTMNGATQGPGAAIATEMHGGNGNDALTGTDGPNLLTGGAGNDRLVGFKGADDIDGGDGDDTMVWDNGDGSDTNDGDAGNDTSIVNGAPGGDAFTVKPGDGGRVRFDRTNLVPFFVDIGSTERLQLNGLDGDDTMNGATQGPGAAIATEMHGGNGNDALTGTDGPNLLTGGAGNDRLVGFKGADDIDGGDGDDTMVWDNGDGSDTNDGDAGNDTSVVNGASPQGDTFTVKPGNGGRVRIDRTNLVPFFVDIGSTERLDVNSGAGNDSISGANGLARLIALDFDGQDGNDSLRGGDGADVLAGGNGRDSIRANDRANDRVNCGAGIDRARINRGDRVQACEAVNRVPDRTRPRVAIGRTVRVSGRTARVRATCSRREFSCTGTIAIRRGGRNLGSVRRSLAGARPTTLSIRLTAAGRRVLAGRRRASATVRYAVRDASGRRRTASVRVTPRRA